MHVRSLILALGIVTAIAGLPSRAAALPGQTIAQFTAWSTQQPLLRGLKRTTDEMSGWPSFTLLTADHGIAWRVDVHTDRTAIVSEGVGVSTAGGEPGSAPVRHDGTGYGFSFFRSLYGAGIAADYRLAPATASFKDSSDGSVTTFYRGKRYGYTFARGYITVETFLAFTRDIAQMRRCTANPGACSE